MTSNGFDTQTWIAAAKRFMRLRRRFWLSFVGGWLVFAIFGLPLIHFGDRLNDNFRCPRCDSTFIMSWGATHSFPTSRCKHCGLDLRAAAMA